MSRDIDANTGLIKILSMASREGTTSALANQADSSRRHALALSLSAIGLPWAQREAFVGRLYVHLESFRKTRDSNEPA
jgi:hypothetical protein